MTCAGYSDGDPWGKDSCKVNMQLALPRCQDGCVMAHRLEKASAPGWVKEFATEDAARAELLSHICKSCLLGEQEYVDSESESGLSVEKVAPPDPNRIGDLLGTPCGCEFWYEPPTSPLSSKDRQTDL